MSRPSVDTALLELDEFFMEQGRIFQTLRKLSHRFSENGIDYAIFGDIALFFHGYKRSTQDIDILLTKSGLSNFQKIFIGRGFMPMFPSAQKTFRDTETDVRVEFLVTGEFPGNDQPKPIVFPDPRSAFLEVDNFRIIDLKNLIELKLASGLSAPDRLKDLADVQELIRVLKLSNMYGEQLDDSVRSEFIRLWRGVTQSQNSPITESPIEYE